MVEKYAITIVICIVAIIVGILLGNSAVYFFNRIPGKWLCDYGQEPDAELLNPTTQRVKSTPWKYCFSALFILIGVEVAIEDPIYAIIVLATCWLLLEMAMADLKYMIVPDQFIVLLMVAAVGFIPHHQDGPMAGIWGTIVGFTIMLFIGILGKVIYRTESLGGGDIKLFTALGLCFGVRGVLTIFVLSTFVAAFHLAFMMLKKRIKLKEKRPLVPYIAVSATIYMVILNQMSYNILIDL